MKSQFWLTPLEMSNFCAGKNPLPRILAEVMSYEDTVFGAHQANGYRENGNGVCLLWPFWPFSKGSACQ